MKEKSNRVKKITGFLTGLLMVLATGLITQAAPVINGVSLDKTEFTPGSGTLRVQTDVTTADSVTCKVKVYNASGKLVFLNKAGTGKGPSFVTYWDGKASADNKAGLKAGEYAPEGTYKVKAVVYYKEDGKTKYVRASLDVKVKTATTATATQTTQTAQKTDTDDTSSDAKVEREPYTPAAKVSSSVSPTVGTKSWDWVVQVTGNKKVDYLAELICQEILTPGMSEFKRCKKIYAWCVMHFTREGGSVKASTSNYKFDLTSSTAKSAMNAYKKQVKAMIKEGTAVVNTSDSQTPNGVYNGWYGKRLQGLGKQVGDCTHAAAAFECLCRHAGLECDIIENSLPSSNPQHHFWNVTRIDGKWYYNDARMENARLYGRTTVKYTMFLRGKVSLAKKEKRYGMIKSKYKKLYAKCEAEDYKKQAG